MPAFRHRRAPTRRASQTHRVARESERERDREREPGGKLSSFDTDSATTARTHVQRVRARTRTRRDYNSLAIYEEEAKSTDEPETYLYDISGPSRIYNDVLNMPLSCRARDERQNAQQTPQATGIAPRTAGFASSSLTCRARPRPSNVVLSRPATIPHNNVRNARVKIEQTINQPTIQYIYESDSQLTSQRTNK